MFPSLKDVPKIKYGCSKIDELLLNSWKTDRLLPEINEEYFFHGTKADRIQGVIAQGLDPRLAMGQAVLGQAIYMAESSTKADQYTG